VPHRLAALPAGAVVEREALAAFAETAAHLYASEDLDETLRRITDVVQHSMPACAMASVSIIHGAEISTHAATGAGALEADRLQYAVGEGPCLAAALEHQLVYVPDTVVDDRWPAFTRQLAPMGLRGLLACGFRSGDEPGRVTGALNLYASVPDAFTEEDAAMALILAVHAGAIVHASLQQQNLRAAIESRDVIGQAKGIVMERFKLTADEAFARLRQSSQALNVKLRDLAERVARTGDLPPEAPSLDGQRSRRAPGRT